MQAGENDLRIDELQLTHTSLAEAFMQSRVDIFAAARDADPRSFAECESRLTIGCTEGWRQRIYIDPGMRFGPEGERMPIADGDGVVLVVWRVQWQLAD